MDWVKNGDNVNSNLDMIKNEMPGNIKIVEKLGIDGRLHRNFITH